MDVPRRRRQRPTWAMLLVATLVLVAAVGGGIALRGPPRPPSVRRAELVLGSVRRGPFVVEVHGTGTLRPEAVRWLTAESSGRVAAVSLKAGAEVEPATLVVQLDNLDLRVQTDHAQRDVQEAHARALSLERQAHSDELGILAELATIEAALSDARRGATAYAEGGADIVAHNEGKRSQERVVELERRQGLAERQLSLIREMLPRELAALKQQLEPLARVQRVREEMLERLEVRAGSKGQLQEVLVELGQWVVPGTPVAKVMLTRQLHAVLRVPADRAGRVRVGQRAEVRTSLGTESQSIAGTVRRVAPAAHQGTVDVEVALDEQLPRNARPDQTVDGTIEIQHVESALQLPRPVGSPESGDVELWVVDAGLARRVPVRLGHTSVDMLEVIAGLEATQTVVLSDMSRYAAHDVLQLE